MQSRDIPLYVDRIFGIQSESEFIETALDAFRYQYHSNPIYRSFCNNLQTEVEHITTLEGIPFLPIELFKTSRIISGNKSPVRIFGSSGTTGSNRSLHHVVDEEIYIRSLVNGFTNAIGNPGDYGFIGLLPGYLERPDSSLIFMVQELMKRSYDGKTHFFPEADQPLLDCMAQYNDSNVPIILFGVSFSLLQFASKGRFDLGNTIIIETGGMKGHGEELTREELHTRISTRLTVKKIYSEYGMTELLSQAYCTSDQVFRSPPWMKILIREINDPFSYASGDKAGGINVIDLANIHSCCFISTQDLGKKTSPNSFEVLGRFDNADIRGCNLLYV